MRYHLDDSVRIPGYPAEPHRGSWTDTWPIPSDFYDPSGGCVANGGIGISADYFIWFLRLGFVHWDAKLTTLIW